MLESNRNESDRFDSSVACGRKTVTQMILFTSQDGRQKIEPIEAQKQTADRNADSAHACNLPMAAARPLTKECLGSPPLDDM